MLIRLAALAALCLALAGCRASFTDLRSGPRDAAVHPEGGARTDAGPRRDGRTHDGPRPDGGPATDATRGAP